jgi:hypothetical protein
MPDEEIAPGPIGATRRQPVTPDDREFQAELSHKPTETEHIGRVRELVSRLLSALKDAEGSLFSFDVHPKMTQDLARHSDINLTFSRYSYTVIGEQASAVAALPDLNQPVVRELRATNTIDKQAAGVLAFCSALSERPAATSVDASGHNHGKSESLKASRKQGQKADFPMKFQLPAAGVEPATYGLGSRPGGFGRCSMHRPTFPPQPGKG